MTLFAATGVKLSTARFLDAQSWGMHRSARYGRWVIPNNGLMLFSDCNCWRTGGFPESHVDIISQLLFLIGKCTMEEGIHSSLRFHAGIGSTLPECAHTNYAASSRDSSTSQKAGKQVQRALVAPSIHTYSLRLHPACSYATPSACLRGSGRSLKPCTIHSSLCEILVALRPPAAADRRGLDGTRQGHVDGN